MCLANGFLLMDRNLPAKYIEAIFELEVDEASEHWEHQLLYHQLAARVTWQGCRSGQPAKIQTIVDAICEDPKKKDAMIKECEQSSTFRRDCQREAMHRPVETWEESCFPGLSLRRCPACLKAVPRQSVRCLQCWGYLLTEEDAIEEIGPRTESKKLLRSRRTLS